MTVRPDAEPAIPHIPQRGRLLVLLLCPIGDTLFATPTLRALRRAYPDTAITVVAHPTNRPLLEDRPDVDHLLTHPTRARASWAGVRRDLAALRTAPFDLGVSLNPVFTPLYRLLASCARWIETPLPPWWWLRSARRTAWARIHAVDIYLRTLDPLRLGPLNANPDLPVSAECRRAALRLLDESGLAGQAPLFALHPGGEGYGGMKRWPAERFAAVGNTLIERYGGALAVLGGPDERELAARVFAGLRAPTVNACGRLTLLETAALLERCRLLVGNDSAPLHMAAAVGVPVVGVYGPSNPDQFAPCSPAGEVVRSGRPCSPCFHFTGTQAFWEHPVCFRPRCLEEVTTEMVLAAVERALRARAPARRAA
ncbi:MAG: glycosyltransferase family 9 protein [Chloroflexi bacterium]|nr:glycosyltransferase family 9 protein [Chloroflexota bacterium]